MPDSCALTELIMHHWTQLKPTDESESSSKTEVDTDQTKVPQQQQHPEYELRPLYQRAGAALGQFCVGALVCILLLNSRARIVHKLYLLPSSSLTETALSPKLPKPSLPRHPKSKVRNEEKILVMQNVYHFRGQGNVFPFSDTTLVQGYDPNEVAFEVKGRRGKFYLGLEGACVNGERFDSAWKAREALFGVWYGEKGKREMARFNWV